MSHMANAEHHRSVRSKRTTKNLNYGHFGTATFEESTHKWRFLRQIQSYHKLDSHGSEWPAFELVHENVQQLKATGVERFGATVKCSSTPGTNHILLKHIPESAIVVESLSASSIDHASKDISRSESTGELIAFGHARVLGDDGFRSRLMPIVALPVGIGGEILRLHGIDLSRFVPDDEVDTRGTWNVPCISLSRIGRWRLLTDPILQISFSTSDDQTHLLIRQSGGTSILRPIIKSDVSAVDSSGSGSTENHAGASPIDPNHMLTIPSARTGGHQHADAVFNPKNPNVLAILDVSGQWSVWKMKGKEPLSARVTVRAKILRRGNMFGSDLFTPVQNVRPDGWYRLCWLNNTSSKTDNFFVCGRASAHVADSEGVSAIQADMRLGPPSDGIVILDLKQSVRDMRALYVLSGSRLQIFSADQLDTGSSSRTEPLNLVCSWSHFRDERDLDMRMSIVEHSQNTCIFLHSHSSSVVTVFQFHHGKSGPEVESSCGPTTLQWPEALRGKVATITGLTIVPVDFRVNNRAFNRLDWGVVKFVAWTTHGEIIEAFYRYKIGNGIETKEANDVIPLLPLPKTTKNRYFSGRLVEENDLDDFVVEDGLAFEYEVQRNGELMEVMRKDAHAFSSAPGSRFWETILNYETLKNDEDFRPVISDSFNQASQQYTDLVDESLPLSTLANLLKEPRILDLEAASQNMDNWIKWIGASEEIHIQPTKIHLTTLPTEVGTGSLLTLYDTFLFTYITPLSPHITNRNRVNREKIVRQTATDAFLSGLGLRSRLKVEGNDNDPQSPTQLLSSQTSVPTISNVSAQSAVSRLRAYATFRSEADAPPEKVGVMISTILDHLPGTIDSDPTNYSYEITNKRIQNAQDEEAELSLDPRERAKIKREAAKRLRNLGKQAQFSQQVQTQRSMIPSVTNHHLAPRLPGREIQSSQPAVPAPSQSQGDGPGMLTMSQPVKGVHGMRPLKKKTPKATPGF
ncbi:hypothetical protein LTR84_013185 [Exophiala bonariae]|uniref:RNA polymerase I-specific transcription initiation factor RRN6-like protein n=1 Tax=Exophiala bonariae TaxID=1690606 RepID=A0AAV9NGM1_9EURO|nr:hypothetical protein LTR84_013185 [Exophiala bonariae]